MQLRSRKQLGEATRRSNSEKQLGEATRRVALIIFAPNILAIGRCRWAVTDHWQLTPDDWPLSVGAPAIRGNTSRTRLPLSPSIFQFFSLSLFQSTRFMQRIPSSISAPCLLLALSLAALAAEPVQFPHWRSYPQPARFVTALAPDGCGGCWAGTEGEGLWHFDGLWWSEVPLPFSYEYPLAITPREDALCLGLSRSGLAILDPAGSWQLHNVWNGLGGHRVYDVLAEAGGTDGSRLSVVGDGGTATGERRERPVRQGGEADEGRVWVGADTGLWMWDGSWRLKGQAGGGGVTAIAVWRGAMVVGTPCRGVWRLSDKELVPLLVKGLPDRRVHDLAVDSQNRLWAATFAGAAVLENDSWQPLTLPIEKRTPEQEKVAVTPQSPAVLALSGARDGCMWLGTRTEGLYRYSPKEKTCRRLGPTRTFPDVFVRSLALDPSGTLWAGMYGGGVVAFEPARLRFVGPDVTFDYADPVLHSSRGWVYDDRVLANALETFVYGRRIRKIQSDAAQRYLGLYFDGPERANELESADSSSAFQGVVLLDAHTGQIRWSLDALPLRPVRWSADGSRLACQTDSTVIRVQDVSGGDPAEQVLTLPEEELVRRFFFLNKERLFVETEEGSGRLYQLSHQPDAPARAEPVSDAPADPAPVHDLTRAALADEPAPWASAPVSAHEATELLMALPGPVKLGPGLSAVLEPPDRVGGPVLLLSFEITSTGQLEEPGRSVKVTLGPAKGGPTYEVGPLPLPRRLLQLCVASPRGSSPSVRVQAPPRTPVTLTNLAWRRPRLKGTKARFLGDPVPHEEEAPPPYFSAASPIFYLCTPDQMGATLRPRQHPKRSGLLFDGNLGAPVWKPMVDTVGWHLVLEFGEPVAVEGVVALSAPGRLSDQRAGLSLERWDEAAEQWRWVRALHGPPQFHHPLFQSWVTSKIRLGATGRSLCLAELLIFAHAVSPDAD